MLHVLHLLSLVVMMVTELLMSALARMAVMVSQQKVAGVAPKRRKQDLGLG